MIPRSLLLWWLYHYRPGRLVGIWSFMAKNELVLNSWLNGNLTITNSLLKMLMTSSFSPSTLKVVGDKKGSKKIAKNIFNPGKPPPVAAHDFSCKITCDAQWQDSNQWYVASHVNPLTTQPQSHLCLKGLYIPLVFTFLYFEMHIWDNKWIEIKNILTEKF